MASSNSPWARLVERWRRDGVDIRPGVNVEAIGAFERRWTVRLPADVRAYFQTVDGMDPGVMDENAHRFWPLEEVRPVPEELTTHSDRLAYPECFVFADWAIWAWAYAVRLTGDATQPAPVYRVTGDDPPGGEISPSFRDFLERYAEDPDSVHGG